MGRFAIYSALSLSPSLSPPIDLPNGCNDTEVGGQPRLPRLPRRRGLCPICGLGGRPSLWRHVVLHVCLSVHAAVNLEQALPKFRICEGSNIVRVSEVLSFGRGLNSAPHGLRVKPVNIAAQ